MGQLSATIITYNEEKNIRDCLESLTWTDEIIVVDSFSTDRTLEICQEYTDRIYRERWKGYARQKNSALEKVSFPWILSIDADERVTPELKEEIAGILEDADKVDGYYLPRRNFFLGRWIRHGGWYPDYTVRLFKKGKGRFVPRKVHESAVISGTTGYLKNPLEHYTYKSVSEFLKRMDRYSTLSAREYFERGRRASPVRILVAPLLTFVRMYIIQRGFLDGYLGFLLSVLYSYYTLTKYAKLKELVDSQGKG
jgi:glycosyltransferase involved in cell wall biosynthesis